MRVVFFGSSQNVFSGRFYQALRQADCEIAAVVDVPAAKRSSTNPTRDDAATDFARDALRPEKGDRHLLCEAPGGPFRQKAPVPFFFDPADPNAPEFVAAMRALRPDLFLAVGYMLRLGSELLAVPRIECANAHASLLPAYRGRSPVFWALRSGERYSGLTIHAMDDRLDTGDLLYRVRVRTRKNDTVASLYDRIIAKGLSLLPRLIADARRGRLPRRAQPAEGGSYFSAAKQSDFRIDWSQPAETVRRWITITPGKCFTTLREEQVHLLDATVVERKKGTGPIPPNGPEAGAERGVAEKNGKSHLSRSSSPGTLLRIAAAGCTIAAGQGAVRLTRIQLASGQELPLSDFCRQIGAAAGDCLGEEGDSRLLPDRSCECLAQKAPASPVPSAEAK